ncbi:MAG TPA: Gfo/Idh/MocA family oxidoreductase [Polyangiales bacterium]|nr:Gfo/Idh/MocA family oxidoreductase [Polyangiales bacterium]
MNVGILGCGLIGQKRAAAVQAPDRVSLVADVLPERAATLARSSGARGVSAEELVRDPGVDIVVIATPHNQLASLALAAVQQGKHVLLEKPGACRAKELEPVRKLAESRGLCVHVGFNHRFHPAMQKARSLIDAGELGPLYYVRGRYGHGGRPGYDREWRAKPEISGGGELLDQGAHLIDLASWYLGAPFVDVHGVIATYFWDMPVEDNAFLTLRTASGMTAQLQVTWTEWKNLFSLEIVGRDAKLQVDGLGGSYGTERLSFFKMKPEMGPPDTTIWEYPGADTSWVEQWRHVRREIAERRVACEPGLSSTQAVLSVVERVYVQNQVSWLAAGPNGAAE